MQGSSKRRKNPFRNNLQAKKIILKTYLIFCRNMAVVTYLLASFKLPDIQLLT